MTRNRNTPPDDPTSPSVEITMPGTDEMMTNATKVAIPISSPEAIASSGSFVPAEGLPKVPLRTFAGLSGVKDDQIAPFLADAMRRKLESRTVPEWRETYQAFLNRPSP
jgi:hypothetical protein